MSSFPCSTKPTQSPTFSPAYLPASTRSSSTTRRPTDRQTSPVDTAPGSCTNRSADSAPRAGPGSSPRPTTSSVSWTATAPSTAPTSSRSRRRCSPATPTSCWALDARLQGFVADACPRREPVSRLGTSPPHRRRSARPRSDARACADKTCIALGVEDRRFGWPLEMVLRASLAGWRIREVDVSYAPRIGRSKVTGTLQGTARAVHDMARVLR